jgi:hypothetical protein
MTYLRRFEGFTPPERDTIHWIGATIEEAATPTDAAATVIQAFTLSPAITDPMSPPSYDFETRLATLAEGWYRIVWSDTNGDEQPTEWVQLRALSPYAPTVADIAAILRARTVELGGVRVSTFTDRTTPTAQQVQDLIALHTPLVFARLGRLDNLHCTNAGDMLQAARSVAAQRVALEVEASYWPDEVGGTAAVDTRRALLDDDMTAVGTMLAECRGSGDRRRRWGRVVVADRSGVAVRRLAADGVLGGGGWSIEARVFGEEIVNRRLLRFAATTVDASDAFRQIVGILRDATEQNFATRGRSGGSRWRDLSKPYAQAHRPARG